jgi:hypothetical protein
MPGDTVEIKDKIVYVNGKEYTKGFENYGVAIPRPLLLQNELIFYLSRDSFDYVSMNPWYDTYYRLSRGDSTAVRKIFNQRLVWPIKVPKTVICNGRQS